MEVWKTPAEVFAHWTKIRAGLIETIGKFEEHQLAYAPFADSRKAGEIMLHIADAEEGWFQHIMTRKLAEWPSQYVLDRFPSRGAIIGALSDVHRATDAFLETLSFEDLIKKAELPGGESASMGWIIWHVIEHEVHHRGELSLILGLLGKEGLDV